jgi:hypothetical protein
MNQMQLQLPFISLINLKGQKKYKKYSKPSQLNIDKRK